MNTWTAAALLALAGCARAPQLDSADEAIRGGVKEINKSVVLLSSERMPCPVAFPLPKPPADPTHLPLGDKTRRLSTCTATIIGPNTLAIAAHCVFNKQRYYVQLPWVNAAKNDNTLVFDVVEAKQAYYYPKNDVGGVKYYISKLKGLAGDFERTNVANTRGFADVYSVSEWADLATIKLNKDIIAAGGEAAKIVEADAAPPTKKPFYLNVDIWGRRLLKDPADKVTTFHTKTGIDGKPLTVSRSSAFPNYLVHEENAPLPKDPWVGPLCNDGDGGGPAYIQCDDPVFGGVLSGMDLQLDASCGDKRRTFWVNLGRPAINKFLRDRRDADTPPSGMKSSPPPTPSNDPEWSANDPPPWAACTKRPLPPPPNAYLPPGAANPYDNGSDDDMQDESDRDEEDQVAFVYDTAMGTEHPNACCHPENDQ